VNKLTRAGKLAVVALAALAMVLAVNAPSQARGMGGHGFGGGHPGGADVHHGFGGHHGFHGGLGFGPVYRYYGYYGYYPPAYGYAPPGYWYYCRSYGAYYPSVGSCPEAWEPVPAS
jgi:hypothetical protein